MAKAPFPDLDLMRQGLEQRKALGLLPATRALPSIPAGFDILSIPKTMPQELVGDELLLEKIKQSPKDAAEVRAFYQDKYKSRGFFPKGTPMLNVGATNLTSEQIMMAGNRFLPPEMVARANTASVLRPGIGAQQYLPFPGETQYAGSLRTPSTAPSLRPFVGAEIRAALPANPVTVPLTSTARQTMATQAQMMLPFGPQAVRPQGVGMFPPRTSGPPPGGTAFSPRGGIGSPPPPPPSGPAFGPQPLIGPPRPPGLPAGGGVGPASSPLGPARGGRLGPPRPPGLPAGGGAGAAAAAAEAGGAGFLARAGGWALRTGLPVAMIAMMWNDVLSKPKRESEEAFIDHLTTVQGMGGAIDFQSMKAQETADELGLMAAIGRLPNEQPANLNRLMKDSIPLFQMASLAAQTTPQQSSTDVDLAKQVVGVR